MLVKELNDSLASTQNIYKQAADIQSTINKELEEKLVNQKHCQEDLENKQSIQQTVPFFTSGDRFFTAGSVVKRKFSLHSPYPQSYVVANIHNCKLYPDYQAELRYGSDFEISVTPNWFATVAKEVENKLWNWFAQVWLEYPGAEYHKQQITELKGKLNKIRTEIAQLQTQLEEQRSTMAAVSSSSEICKSLHEHHILREFLQQQTFPLSDFEILCEAFPLTDTGLLLKLQEKRRQVVHLSQKPKTLVHSSL